MGAPDSFEAHLAVAAKVGRQEAIKEILQWANEHKDALRAAGLVESLLKTCGQQ